MKNFIAKTLIASIVVAASSVSLAHDEVVTSDINDPVTLRINIMKNVGAATGILGAMMKGEADFNATSALAALMTINNASLGMAAQFPEGFESPIESFAAPAVWQNNAGFNAAIAKFVADSSAAVAAKPADMGALRTVFGTVSGNCRACHEDFRIRH